MHLYFSKVYYSSNARVRFILFHSAVSNFFSMKLQTNIQSRYKVVYSKVKILPYSLPSVGSGADPGVQAVSPQVT